MNQTYTQSANPASYITQPPNIPYFLYKYTETPVQKMIQWAEKEFQDRLIYCSERGYWKSLKQLNDNYSPIRILAESHGFRYICAMLQKSPQVWKKLSRKEREFIMQAYQLRDILFR